MKLILSFIAFLFLGMQFSWAQFPPRQDDHFWRKKIIWGIDLKEKVNRQIITKADELQIYNPEEEALKKDNSDKRYTNYNGLILALMHAFDKGEIEGYHPDTLSQTITHKRAEYVLKGFLQTDAPSEGGGSESSGDDGEDDDEFGEDADLEETPEPTATGGTQEDVLNTPQSQNEELYRPMTYRMEFGEDLIFDKNKSDIYHDLQWIRFVAVDAYGKLGDKNVVAFKYKDVMALLDNTLWKNEKNDAEFRSLREVFELRLFNSYLINLSGRQAKTLAEAAKRSQQLVEFEHHLWEF